MMKKKFYKSKTMWGFGLLAIIAIFETLGLVPRVDTTLQLAKILVSLLGIYGLRDAMK